MEQTLPPLIISQQMHSHCQGEPERIAEFGNVVLSVFPSRLYLSKRLNPMPNTLFTFFAVVFLISSTANAAEPLVIAKGTAPRLPQQPQIAVEEGGAIHIVYG